MVDATRSAPRLSKPTLSLSQRLRTAAAIPNARFSLSDDELRQAARALDAEAHRRALKRVSAGRRWEEKQAVSFPWVQAACALMIADALVSLATTLWGI